MLTAMGGTTAPARVPRKESWPMAFGFIATTEDLLEGSPVKLNADGTVELATAADFPIGIVDVGGKNVYAETGRITVLTVFNAEIKGVAIANINAGVPVAIHSVTLVNGVRQIRYAAAAAGQYAIGITMATGVAGGAVTVGSLRVPYKVA